MSIKLYARGSHQALEQSTFPGGERERRAFVKGILAAFNRQE